MSHILDYMLHWSGLTLALGGALVAFLYLPLPFKLPTVYACLGLAVALLAYDRGYSSRDKQAKAEQATYELAVAHKDLEINTKATELATAIEAKRRSDLSTNKKVAALVQQFEAAGRCRVTDDERKRLLDIDR